MIDLIYVGFEILLFQRSRILQKKEHKISRPQGWFKIYKTYLQLKILNEWTRLIFSESSSWIINDKRARIRVTTKKMKFEARKLKFCTWGLEGRPDLKIEKKISKNFTPTQNAKFWYLRIVSLKFPQKLSGDVEFNTDQHTKRTMWANAHSGRYTDKKLIKSAFYW